MIYLFIHTSWRRILNTIVKVKLLDFGGPTFGCVVGMSIDCSSSYKLLCITVVFCFVWEAERIGRQIFMTVTVPVTALNGVDGVNGVTYIIIGNSSLWNG
jgi:hypothetical protein